MRDVVVTPTYNEKANIAALVERVFALHPEIHILVVDDNSPDGTGAVVAALIGRYPNLHLLSRPAKLGFSSAYRDAFALLLAEQPGLRCVVTLDADLSHDPVAIGAMLAAVESHELVVGSRYVRGGRIRNWPPRRRLLSRCANLYARFVTGTPIRDLTTGFVCYRSDLLRRLDLDALMSVGFSVLMELKILAARMGARVREIPIVCTERREGKSKLSRRIVWEGLLLPLRFAPGLAFLQKRRAPRGKGRA